MEIDFVVTKCFERINEYSTKKGRLTGVRSGFRDVDSLTWGFQRQDLIVIAGAPAVGKTSLVLNCAENAALPPAGKGEPVGVLIFSLEMSLLQIGSRLVFSRARVNEKLMREGLLMRDGPDTQRLTAAAAEFSKAPIYIDDTPKLTAPDLLKLAAEQIELRKIGLIVVDGIQLLSPIVANSSDDQRVSDSVRGLKTLARELDVPVIATSSLNRSPGKENRRPKMADLRGSGAIEDVADVVMVLAPRTDESVQYSAGSSDTAELIVAKQRNGPVGELLLTFLRDIMRFENYVS
jgi:replicative DNA helicase